MTVSYGALRLALFVSAALCCLAAMRSTAAGFHR